MKTSSYVLILVVAVVSMSLLALTQVSSVEIPTGMEPTLVGQREQYRVLDTSRLMVPNAQAGAATLETALNEMAAQGWRVRASVGNTVILAR